MYTNEDLKQAIDRGIFTTNSVDEFRQMVSENRPSPQVDEENFRLISGFNDIFVVIASLLMLISAYWIVGEINYLLSMVVVAILSWGLAEFFVRRRKMSFPAIVLLVTFVGSIFFASITMFETYFHIGLDSYRAISSAITIIFTYLHWRRFGVPITVASGVLVPILFVISTILSISPQLEDYIFILTLLAGMTTFIIALRWDMEDTKRITKNTDVAFWLHLISSPLIVHSIFSLIGVFDYNSDGMAIIINIIILYIILSSISLIIDRRAFMVSSLAYVVYALNSLFNIYGIENNSFAIVGVIIGFSLLLLSAYWTKVRKLLLKLMPQFVRDRVPLA